MQRVLLDQLAQQFVQSIVRVARRAQELLQVGVQFLDAAVRVLLVVQVEDSRVELVVGFSVGYMVVAAQGVAQGMNRAHAGVPERDTGEVAGHQHFTQVFETVVGTLFGNALEDIDDDAHGFLAERFGIGVRLGRNEGFGSVNQSIDRAASVELERQALQQFRNQDGIVGHDGIVGQAHLGMQAYQFGNRDVGHFAARAASGRQDNQLLVLHDRNLAQESIGHVFNILQHEYLAAVDDRTAAHRDDTVVIDMVHVLEDGVHHVVRRFAQTVLFLHDEMAGQVQRLHERFVQEFVGNDQVVGTQVEFLGK